jgi:hypothetical protein
LKPPELSSRLSILPAGFSRLLGDL